MDNDEIEVKIFQFNFYMRVKCVYRHNIDM